MQLLKVLLKTPDQQCEWNSGFNGTQTNCRIVHNLGNLLMNSNCFAIFFSCIIVVCSDIYLLITARLTDKLSSNWQKTILSASFVWFRRNCQKKLRLKDIFYVFVSRLCNVIVFWPPDFRRFPQDRGRGWRSIISTDSGTDIMVVYCNCATWFITAQIIQRVERNNKC